MIARKASDGNLYAVGVLRTPKHPGRKSTRTFIHTIRFLNNTVIGLNIENIYFPKEYLGKKIRIKIELEDEQ